MPSKKTGRRTLNNGQFHVGAVDKLDSVDLRCTELPASQQTLCQVPHIDSSITPNAIKTLAPIAPAFHVEGIVEGPTGRRECDADKLNKPQVWHCFAHRRAHEVPERPVMRSSTTFGADANQEPHGFVDGAGPRM